MIPISAASIAPRNEVSSQGCTTIVVAGFTSFARAMRRSYFEGDEVWLDGIALTPAL